MTDLQKRTQIAVFWSSIDVLLRQGFQLLVLVFLARMLTPEDFGAIAMLNLFVGLAAIFIDCGFSSALIQKRTTTAAEETSVFYFNIAMGIITALLLCLLAPWIATYFDQPVLLYLSYALAFNLLVNSLGSIHITLLNKDLNFKTIAKVSGVSVFISGALAVILASNGYGVWSLVAQTVSQSMVTVFLLWLWHPWRPIKRFSFVTLHTYFRFGGYLFINDIIGALHANIYAVLISKYFTVYDAGLYDRAQRTQLLPVNLLMTIINRVAYPVFSAVANDKDRLARGLRKTQCLAMFVSVPFMTTIILLAEPLTVVLFGPQWLPCVPILQVLALDGMIWPLHLLNLNALKAQGRSDLFFCITLIKKSLAIGLIFAACHHGIMAMAWAQVIASFLGFAINAHYTRVFLNYGAINQVRDLLPYLIGMVPAGFGMWLIINSYQFPPLLGLILSLVTGSLLYLLSSRALRINALSEVMDILRTFRKATISRQHSKS